MILCTDSAFIEFYCKDRDVLDKVYNNCIRNGFQKVQYKSISDVNPSLAFKFENDFGIILPEFDGHECDISEYLLQIKKIIKKNDWEVFTDVHLTLLSFLKINMYKDYKGLLELVKAKPSLILLQKLFLMAKMYCLFQKKWLHLDN